MNIWYPQNRKNFKARVNDYEQFMIGGKRWRIDFDVGGHAHVYISTILFDFDK